MMAVVYDTLTSQLYSHGRSDPEYYLPLHTKVEDDLKRVPTLGLGQLGHLACSAFYPAATHLYSPNGIPFLRCVDIIDFPVISSDQSFARIPQDFVDSHSSIRSLSRNDIIISKVGSPCFVSILSDEMPTSAMTRTVMGMSRIRIDLVDPYYLVAFLRSRFGFNQLMRERELTIQYQLTLERTRRVRVFSPRASIQESIGNLVRAHYRELRASIDSYTQAEQLLESELGLDKLTFDKPVVYSARFSQVSLSSTMSAGRIDAQCFAPDAIFYENWLRKHTICTTLGQLLLNTAKGKQQSESTNGKYDYCSIKHISGRELSGVSKCSPSRDIPLASQNDLLLAITGATIGKIGIVKRYSTLAFSGDLLRLRNKAEINPHYMLLVLDHQISQVQLIRWITGSTNGHLGPRDIERVLIPRLGEAVESRISSLVEQSLTKRIESEQLLEQAKSRVEALIEEVVKA